MPTGRMPQERSRVPQVSALATETLAVDLDVPLVGAVLGETGVVHHRHRSDATGEAGLLDGGEAGREGDVGRHAVGFVAAGDPQHVQRLDHLDLDRADPGVEAFHVQRAGGVHVVLLVAADDAERGIHDVQVGVDAQRGREEQPAVLAVAVEEVAVVEVAVGARVGDRLGGLVDGIVVGFC
jgi:hypothetical protein